jgi:hypothetical protein
MNAGTYQEHGVYKTFQPRLLADHLELSDKEIAIFYGDAMRYLGELNAYSQLVPNIDYFIHVYRKGSNNFEQD